MEIYIIYLCLAAHMQTSGDIVCVSFCSTY